MITGADPFQQVSRISAEAFATIVHARAAAGVVAERQASDYHQAALGYGIDPLFLLAMFNHESGMGRAGVAQQTRSWGNTRLPSFGVQPIMQHGEPLTVAGRSGRFPVYATWLDGAISTVARLASTTWPPAAPYGERTTIRGVFDHPSGSVWAPAGDLNDPHGYLAAMLEFMNVHTDQDQPIMAGGTPLGLTIHTDLTPVNFTYGRNGHTVRAICLHITDGDTAAGAISWFHNPASDVSAHYVVDRAGTIWQVVAEADTAWTQGVLREPNLANPIIAGWVRDGVNPNSECVSIEAVGKPAQGWTTKQLAVVDLLVRDIAGRWAVPVGVDTVIGHRDIDSVNRARCPSLTPAQWTRMRQPVQVTDDQRMEAYYLANAARLGPKKYAAQLALHYYTGAALVCQNGVVTPDGEAIAGNIVDDWEGVQAANITKY